MLPIFAQDILFVGPKGLGALRAAPAVGATLMSFYLSNRKLKGSAGRWLFSAVGGFGVCILVFGMSHSFWLSLGALAISGSFDSISMVIRSSAVQLSSPDHMRGKISAVNSIFIGSSNEIGELESESPQKFWEPCRRLFRRNYVLTHCRSRGVFSPSLRNMDLEKLTAKDTLGDDSAAPIKI